MGEGEQRDIVGRLLSRISNLQAAAVTAEATRRQLHNQMVELRGNVSADQLCSFVVCAITFLSMSSPDCRLCCACALCCTAVVLEPRNPRVCCCCHPITCTQIRVFCRVRPHPQSVVRCHTGGTSLSLALDSKEHQFNFDKVFGPGTQQQQVSHRHSPRRVSACRDTSVSSSGRLRLAGQQPCYVVRTG